MKKILILLLIHVGLLADWYGEESSPINDSPIQEENSNYKYADPEPQQPTTKKEVAKPVVTTQNYNASKLHFGLGLTLVNSSLESPYTGGEGSDTLYTLYLRNEASVMSMNVSLGKTTAYDDYDNVLFGFDMNFWRFDKGPIKSKDFNAYGILGLYDYLGEIDPDDSVIAMNLEFGAGLSAQISLFEAFVELKYSTPLLWTQNDPLTNEDTDPISMTKVVMGAAIHF